MTLEQRIIALAQAIGVDIKAIYALIGLLPNLTTTDKTSIVAAINEVKATADSATQGGITQAQLDAAILQAKDDLTNGATTALDTFAELEAALGNDPNFATTIATALANRVRFDAPQTLTEPQKLQANQNTGIGNHDHDFVADYNTSKA